MFTSLKNPKKDYVIKLNEYYSHLNFLENYSDSELGIANINNNLYRTESFTLDKDELLALKEHIRLRIIEMEEHIDV